MDKADGTRWTITWKGAAALGAATIPQSVPYIGSPMTQPPPQRVALGTATQTALGFEQLIDLKLAASEARTETKFAQLLGEIKLIGKDVAVLTTNLGTLQVAVDGVKNLGPSIKWNIGIAALTIGLTLGGLILGLFAYGTQMLDLASALLNAK